MRKENVGSYTLEELSNGLATIAAVLDTMSDSISKIQMTIFTVEKRMTELERNTANMEVRS